MASSELIENIKEFMYMWNGDNPVNIVVTGMTGSGKSSLINAIIKEDIKQVVAEEGKDLKGVTRDVTIYSKEVKGIQFNVWDTPGLQDISESDDKIIEHITTTLKQECTHIHLLVYCLRMDSDNITINDRLTIKSVTDCFGPKIWETSVIALTFANKAYIPPEMETDELESVYFKQKLVEYKHEIIKILIEYQMDKQKASEIAVIPTGYHMPPARCLPYPYRRLPDREDWLNPFWNACTYRMRETPYRKDFDKLCKTKEAASCKEDLLTKQVEDNKKKIESLHKQTEQHQHLVKRMRQEQEAKVKEQETKMLGEIKKKILHEQAEQHQHLVKRMQREHEATQARMKEQETKMLGEIKKLHLQVKDNTKTIKSIPQQQEPGPSKIEQKNNKLKIGKKDHDSITSLVSTIRDVFTINIARLRSLLQDSIEVFAEEMLQEQLISDAVTRNPKHKSIVDNFLAKLNFMTEKEEIEQHCGKFLKVLQNVGEQGASKFMKKQLTDAVKTRLNIDLYLDNYCT